MLNKKHQHSFFHEKIIVRVLGVFVIITMLMAAGCEDNPGKGELTEVEKQFNALQEATADFDDIAQAKKAGWDTRFPPECLTHSELGGMGVHQLNSDLVNNEVIVTQPELIVYEPQANGSVRIVAVEYIVPFSIRPRDATPPKLFEREFKHNETYDVWALHAWLVDNSNGTFKSWNPDITCAYADTVRTFSGQAHVH